MMWLYTQGVRMNRDDDAAKYAAQITDVITAEIHKAGFAGYCVCPQELTIGTLARIAGVLGVNLSELVAKANALRDAASQPDPTTQTSRRPALRTSESGPREGSPSRLVAAY